MGSKHLYRYLLRDPRVHRFLQCSIASGRGYSIGGQAYLDECVLKLQRSIDRCKQSSE